MEKLLTADDKKILKYECRAGIALASLCLSMGLFFIFISRLSDFKLLDFTSARNGEIIILASVLFISILLLYLMTRKSIADIRSKYKILETKIITEKEFKIDYEAGSGRTYNLRQEMKPFDSYSIIVDNTRYRVDQKFFDKCKKGDEVVMHYTKKSRNLIRFELKKTPGLQGHVII